MSQLSKAQLFNILRKNNKKLPSTSSMDTLQSEYNKLNVASRKISSFFSRRKGHSDIQALSKINSLENIKIPLVQFNRIMHKIIAPADHFLTVTLISEDGTELSTFNVYNSMIQNKDLFITENEGVGSDPDADIDILPGTQVQIDWINSPKNSRNEKKNFFKYLTKEDYQLKDFQVYYDHITRSANIPCFLYALKKAGCSEEKLNSIKSTMFLTGATNQFISHCAKTFDLHISIKQLKNNNKNNTTHYGDNSLPELALGSVGKHLFAIKPTKVSKHALLHPEFSTHKNFPSIVINGRGNISKNKSTKLLDSFQVISHLYNHRDEKLIPITQSNTPNLRNNDYHENLTLCEEDFNDNNFKLCSNGKIDGKSPFLIYKKDTKEFVEESFNVCYFDLETAPNNFVHTPHRVSFQMNGGAVKSFDGLNCISRFLKELPKGNTLIWAHNAGFDSRFLISHFSGFINKINIIESGTRVKQISGKYFGRNLVIKDTMAFLNYPLSKFPSLFPKACNGVTLEKESFPHDLVTIDNFNSTWSIDYLKEGMNKTDLNTLLTNAKKINAFDGENFDTRKYSEHYCNRDVIVMSSCFEAFRKMFIERFEIDVYRFLSMPSIAYAIQNNEYCFDDCYKMRGNALAFARAAIVGGRVMCNNNEKSHNENKLISKLPNSVSIEVKRKFIEYLDTQVDEDTISFINAFQCNDNFQGDDLKLATLEFMEESKLVNEKLINLILDFDAVSLYPSAQARIQGYVRGKPKLFRGEIPECDYFIAKVHIDSLGKKRAFPLQSLLKEDGTRDFTNDIIGKEIILGKEALEDLVKFQNITYTSIEGMYWTDGFNDQITKTIKELFNERVILKKQKNPLQEGIKLLMNSAYGKLIQKPIVKEKIFVQDTKFDMQTKKTIRGCINAYMCKNINKVISKVHVNKNIAIFEQYKPIYEHFSPAHLGVQILDSSKHIMNEVMCLAEDKGYKIWYQDTDSMHIDRSVLDKLDKDFQEKYHRKLKGEGLGQFNSDFSLSGSNGDVYATESYFLGKKSYIDQLACEGNDSTGFHIRMKGIPSKLLNENPLELYKSLFEGNEHEFDLTKCCPIIINTKTQRVLSRSKAFTRKVYFN